MAKIKDWEIDCGRLQVFLLESGNQILIRDERGDVALIRETPEHFTIAPDNNALIIINDSQKKITITRK